MTHPMRYIGLLLLIFLMCSLSGCASLYDGSIRPEPGAEYLPENSAREVSERLARMNAGIETCKGTGKLKIIAQGQRRATRIVWAGMAPDKLRIEILGLPGQSAARIALNEGWITFDPHDPDRFYKHKLGNDSLKPVLSIAIKAQDLIDLFRGQLPIREHSRATLYRRPPADGYILQLEKRWWGVQQKIYLDDTLTKVLQIEIYDLTGEFVYRTIFDRIKTVDGYALPHKLMITNDAGDQIELDIARYLINIPVNPAAFVLTPKS